MTDIAKQPWFHGLLPREDVKAMLKTNGDFLIRTSEPVAGRARHLILSLLQNSNDPEGTRHYVICEETGKFSVVEDKIFTSIHELLDYYKTKRINPKEDASILINPVNRQFWELSHENITLTKRLGEGAFGEVKKGTLKTKDGVVDVAVKVAKLETCTKEQIKEIMAEARLMRNFDHKNVVKCYGTAAGQEPLMVVMELVPGGGLDSYLTKNKVAMDVKMDIIYQVAQGVEYLHKQEVIHRDIAARNCLYGNGIVKVSDFGLSRRGTSYQMNPKNKVPIRWLAPETLQTFFYSGPSDVFAFGILCWEVLENGQQPYPDMKIAEVHQKVLKEGYRMPIPPEAPHDLAELIRKCWVSQPSDRPMAEALVRTMCRLVPPEKREKVAPQPDLQEKSCPDDDAGAAGGEEEAKTQPIEPAPPTVAATALPGPAAAQASKAQQVSRATTATATTATAQTSGMPPLAKTQSKPTLSRTPSRVSQAQTPSKSRAASQASAAASNASTVTGGGKKKRRNRFLDMGNPLAFATKNVSATQSHEEPSHNAKTGGASHHLAPVAKSRSRPSVHMLLSAERKNKPQKFANNEKPSKSVFGKKKKRTATNLQW